MLDHRRFRARDTLGDRIGLLDAASKTPIGTKDAPACPVAGEMPVWVENAVRSVPGVREVEVKMVFDPPWTVERMSDEAKVALNWY